MTTGTPPAEVNIDDGLVRRLLESQHPDVAHLPLQLVDTGWDNAMYRLGTDFAVRLPRRRQAIELLKAEQTWLPVLADTLPLSIPSPIRRGLPGHGYPWPWSIVPWISGVTADRDVPRADQAQPFADFLRALHRPSPVGIPRSELRGVPLCKRAESVQQRLESLQDQTDVVNSALWHFWRCALAAPESSSDALLHGDLHARNVIVESAVIAGVIDWGDITAGDVATDLASVWILFSDVTAREACLHHYGASADVVARARGWAIFFGATLLATGLVDHPAHAAIGRSTLQRIAAGP